MNTCSIRRSVFSPFRLRALAAGWAAALCLGATAQAGESPASPAAGWGVSSSAHSLGTVAEWFPVMSGAGITHVRGFPVKELQGRLRRMGAFLPASS